MIMRCELCRNLKTLERSHIVPKSFFKDVKDGDSQLYVIQKDEEHAYTNSDPKERLLCNECEQFLSREFESYGTRLLKNGRNVIKKNRHIEFKTFNYEKWYLFFLSILWRASISTIKEFEHIDLGDLSEVLRNCIKNKTLKIADNLAVDEFVVITMFRVVDRSKKLEDSVLKKIMLIPTYEEEGKDHLFFMMVNGFLIQYRITTHYAEMKKRINFSKSDMFRLNQKNVRIIDITESKFLCENFEWLISNA